MLELGSGDRDGGGDPNFDRCVNGGQHCVCLGVSQGGDEVGELGELSLRTREIVCMRRLVWVVVWVMC